MGTRRERVVLELDDQFTAGTLRAAAAAKVLDKELDGVGRQTRVVSERQKTLSSSSNQAGSDIDRLSGRLSLLARGLGVFGPAAVPITTSVVPALSAMATGLTFTVAAAGTAVLAFQGVGDALTALQKYHLQPTQDNLIKFQAAMQRLSPAAQDLVLQLREMGPALKDIRDAAADGLLPGVTDGLQALEPLLPRIEKLLHTVGDATGDLFHASAEDLAGPGWQDFFTYLQHEARPTLMQLGHATGDFAHGLANLWMGLDPLSHSALDGLSKAAEHFERWSEGLDQNASFQEFLAYVQETGPEVLDTLQAVGGALLDIAEAWSSVGGPVLEGLKDLAKVISLIADSPMGPPLMAAVTAMSALSLATSGWAKISKTAWATNISGAKGAELQALATKKAFGLGVAGLAALTLQTAGATNGLDLTTTSMGIMAGAMVGPWGAAIGGSIGLIKDFGDTADKTADDVDRLNKAIADRDRVAIAQEMERTLKDEGNAYDGLRGKMHALGDGFDLAYHQIFGGKSRWDKLADNLSNASNALFRMDPHVGTTAGALDTLLAPALGGAEDKALGLSHAILDLDGNLKQLDRTLARRANRRALEADLDAARKALKDNGKTLNRESPKGRENADALDKIVADTGKMATYLKGVDRLNFLTEWREKIKGVAEDFGMMPAAAEAFVNKFKLFRDLPKDVKPASDSVMDLLRQADKIQGLDPEITPKANTTKADRDLKNTQALLDKYGITVADPKILADVDQAVDNIATVQAMLHAIDPIKKITISVSRIMSNVFPGDSDPGGILTPADGGTVPRTGLPYADRHPALLADGEEVISNRYGQADRHRALLKRINANRLADGGTAGSTTSGDDSDANGVHDLGKESRKAAKALRAEREERQKHLDMLKSMREQLVSSVRDQFRESPFDVEGSPWASGAGNWRRSFRADIADARAFSAAEVRLKKRGLGGGALSYLLQNADPDTVQAFSHYSRAELAQYEHLYRVRQRVSGHAGTYAGDTAYGAQIDELKQELRKIHHELRHRHPQQTGKAAGKALTGAARTGARNAR